MQAKILCGITVGFILLASVWIQTVSASESPLYDKYKKMKQEEARKYYEDKDIQKQQNRILMIFKGTLKQGIISFSGNFNLGRAYAEKANGNAVYSINWNSPFQCVNNVNMPMWISDEKGTILTGQMNGSMCQMDIKSKKWYEGTLTIYDGEGEFDERHGYAKIKMVVNTSENTVSGILVGYRI